MQGRNRRSAASDRKNSMSLNVGRATSSGKKTYESMNQRYSGLIDRGIVSRLLLFGLLGAAVAPALVLRPGPAHAGVEEEIGELRKELAEIRKEVGEIKNLLQSALKPQSPPKITASVSISGKPSLGRQDAPVTLVEFSDYQCPFCKRHFSTVYPILKKDYIDTGKLRYVFRDFPIAGLHPQAQKAHEAAYCAGEQKKYWEMHDMLFENSQDLSVSALKGYATKIALNNDQFSACLESGKYTGEIEKEISEGTQAGVSGTPAFFIGPSGSGEKITGTLVSGAQPLTRFKQVIEDLLKVANQADKSMPKNEEVRR
jgi:protein-disulfide isomerase